MMDSAPYVAFIKDEAGSYVYINAACEKLLGVTAEELIGKTDDQVFSPQAALQNRQNDAHVLVTGDVMRSFETFRLADGTSREWSCLKFRFQGPGGRRLIAGACNDVTDQRRAHRTVTESQRRLKTALEASYDSFFVLDACRDAEGKIEDFVFIDLNRNGERLLERDRWEVVGQKLRDLTPLSRLDGFFEKYVRVTETRTALEEEFPIEDRAGRFRWFRHQVVPLGDGIAITTREVTDQKRAEATAREHTRVLENALGGIAFIADQGWFTYANAEFCRMLGLPQEELLGQPWEVVIDPEDVPRVSEIVQNAPAEDRTEIQCRGRRVDGQPLFMRCLLISVASREGAGGSYFFAQDVTQQRRYESMLEEQNRLLTAARADLESANARLHELATTDGLTGLRNRRDFSDRLAAEFASARRYGRTASLVMMDVDRFKQYNDTFGHPAGDDVLRGVADVLRSQARTMDVFGRYGGEEFAMLLPDTDLAGAIALAERCRTALEARDWPHRAVTASFGCSELCEEFADSTAWVQAADKALYRSKETGRNRVTPSTC